MELFKEKHRIKIRNKLKRWMDSYLVKLRVWLTIGQRNAKRKQPPLSLSPNEISYFYQGFRFSIFFCFSTKKSVLNSWIHLSSRYIQYGYAGNIEQPLSSKLRQLLYIAVYMGNDYEFGTRARVGCMHTRIWIIPLFICY